MFNKTSRLSGVDIPKIDITGEGENLEVIDLMSTKKLTNTDLESAIKSHGSIMGGGYGVITSEGSYMIISSDKGTDIIGADGESILDQNETIGQLPLHHIETLKGASARGEELIIMCKTGADTYRNKFSA